jgi:hypothetical protein
MKTVEEICSHRIEFDYHSNSKNAVPDESEIEHVQNCLIDNCKAGSLNMLKIINGREYEFNGWWKILD